MTTVVLPPPSSATTASAVDVVASPSSKSSSSSIITTIDASTNQNENADELTPEEEEAAGVDEVAEKEEQSENNNERHGNSVVDSKHEASATKRAATSSEPRHKKRPRVSFESADIVEFEPTIYTTTVTSGGIPLGMSFTERSRSRRRLDSWEMERTEVRVGRQNYMEEGYLDPTERETILNKTGCDEPTMVVVEAEVNRIIAHRRESNEVDFEFMYGLGEVGDGLVEEDEDEEDEEEDEEMNELEEEEEGQDEEEEESAGGGFSSEEEDAGDGVLDGSSSDVSDRTHT